VQNFVTLILYYHHKKLQYLILRCVTLSSIPNSHHFGVMNGRELKTEIVKASKLVSVFWQWDGWTERQTHGARKTTVEIEWIFLDRIITRSALQGSTGKLSYDGFLPKPKSSLSC